jgi:transcriptional regulator with XRE-family HTH domain
VPRAYNRNVFAEFVEQARQNLGIDQEQLAKAVGLRQQSVSKWETGVSRPKPAGIPQLAHALGVASHDVLELAGYLGLPPEDHPQFEVTQTLPDGSEVTIVIDTWGIDTPDEDLEVRRMVTDVPMDDDQPELAASGAVDVSDLSEADRQYVLELVERLRGR